MTVMSRSSVHVLVSEGWDEDEELLDHHVECPGDCATPDEEICSLYELVADIGFTDAEHLRVAGRYPFQAVWTRDYFGEYDAHIEEPGR